MAKATSRDARVSLIAEQIEKGTETAEILRFFTENYGRCTSAIEKDIKNAKDIVSKRNEAKEVIRVSTMSKEYAEAVKGQIISDAEIEAILCKIVVGGVQVEEFIKGVPVLRDVSPTEIIQAAKTVFVKRGSNAPFKVAETDPQGNAVQGKTTEELIQEFSLFQKLINDKS